jgi:DNA (cytosine-5)-methyltransferase 1
VRRGGKDVITEKVERLRRGHAPRVLDLFAGCGGLSLGFQRAGFDICAAIEIDEIAASTHALNFYGRECPEVASAHAQPRDITTTEPDELTESLFLGRSPHLAFDVVIGGPPCQAYARVGRAKLREVADHPSAFKVDPRGNLYLRYLEYVKATRPLAILMENVPDVLNYGGHNVMAEVAEALTDFGYTAKYSLINAAFHGVPQIRDRVFLIAHHQALDAMVTFPAASNHMVLPPGYEGTRAVALRYVDLFGAQYFEEADLGTSELPFAVTCEEAIGDLPPITLHLEGKLRRGARRMDELIPYGRKVRLSRYARMMREEWPGFEARPEGLRDHVIRYLPRDADIFRHMPNDGEYPAAHETAVMLWRQAVKKAGRRSGSSLKQAQREKLYRQMVPPYPVHSFPNRWWKLRPDFPSRTLMAHIGKDTYSHIHYDSAQARVISVREAARLQSFPDGFIFCGTMNPAYRQIGNAVPPLTAMRLAERILVTLRQASARMSARKVVVAE